MVANVVFEELGWYDIWPKIVDLPHFITFSGKCNVSAAI